MTTIDDRHYDKRLHSYVSNGLAQLPSLVLNDHDDNLWNGKQDSRTAKEDALQYSERFKQEADFVMSRTNNHVHIRDPKTGKKRPLPGCISKKATKFIIQKDFIRHRLLVAVILLTCLYLGNGFELPQFPQGTKK